MDDFQMIPVIVLMKQGAEPPGQRLGSIQHYGRLIPLRKALLMTKYWRVVEKLPEYKDIDKMPVAYADWEPAVRRACNITAAFAMRMSHADNASLNTTILIALTPSAILNTLLTVGVVIFRAPRAKRLDEFHDSCRLY